MNTVNGKAMRYDDSTMRLVDEYGMFLNIETEHKIPVRDFTKEISRGGVAYWSGFIQNDEFNDKLTGSEGVETYDKMRRTDAQVQAVLYAVMLPVLSANWDIIKPDSEEAAKNISDAHLYFAKENFFEHLNWPATLRHALSCLWAGFSWFEKVYEIQDGKIYLKKLSPRLSTTLWRWWVDDADRLIGVTQRIQKGAGRQNQDIDVPIDKMLLFSYQQEGNNYEGQSLLRGAYKSWYIKDQIYRIDAIRHERYAIGVPHITMPEDWDSNTLNEAKAIGKNWKGAEQSYVVTPPNWTVEIVQMTSAALDVLGTIQHHNEEIAKAALAQFINFGTTQTGSRALGESSSSFFYDAEISLCDWLADIFTRQVLWPILDLNFGNKPRPLIKANNIGSMAIGELTNALKTIGDYLPPDLDLENHLRKLLRLPPKKESVAMPVIPAKGKPEEGEEETAEIKEPELQIKEKNITFEKQVKAYQLAAREMRPSEQCLALADIELTLYRAKERLVRKMLEIRDVWIDNIGGRLREAESLANIMAIDLPIKEEKKLAERLEAILDEIYHYGMKSVRDELSKQKGRLTLQEDLDQPGIFGIMRFRAKGIAKKLATKTIEAAQQEAITLYRTRDFTEWSDEDLGTVLRTLYEVSEKEAQILAGYNLAESFNFGRHQQAREYTEQIAYAEYSAIMDTRTCIKCQAVDGEQMLLDSARYRKLMPPLFACLGKNRCRCIFVYVLKSELKEFA